MSRQFSFYLLPSDIEVLLTELRTRVGVKIIQTLSSSLMPVELNSPMMNQISRKSDSVYVQCCLTVPSGADVRMKFCPTQSHWIIADESEVMEFSGCDYDVSVLMSGRFYFQNDMLIDDTIWPKPILRSTWKDQMALEYARIQLVGVHQRRRQGRDPYTIQLNVTYSPVPEPSSIACSGPAFLALRAWHVVNFRLVD